MSEFLMIFRADYSSVLELPEEQQQAMTQRWMDWVMNIAAQGHLVDRGNRLFDTGRTVSGNDKATNGPYTEVKEFIGGYSMIRAASYDEAVALVKDCPVFMIGGRVEIREVRPL